MVVVHVSVRPRRLAMTWILRVAAVAVWLLAIACSPGGSRTGESAAVPGYQVVRDVRLPGDTSRWDYQVYDPGSHRLYIAHLGASQIVIYDTLGQRVAGVIDGVDQVHGLVLAPDLGRLYASATGRNQVAVVDTSRLKVVATAPTGDYPDGLAYVPDAGKVYVSNEHDSFDTVLDARTNRSLGRVEVGGAIGNTQYDPATHLVNVASGSDNRLVVIDPGRDAVLGRYPLSGCDGAHGVYLDSPEQHRIFVACEGNARLAVFDLGAKTVTTVVRVGDGPDVLALDPNLHRLYVASESGTLSVFDVAGPVRRVAEGSAGPNAHSVAVDPDSHLVYLPLTDVAGHPVLRELRPTCPGAATCRARLLPRCRGDGRFSANMTRPSPSIVPSAPAEKGRQSPVGDSAGVRGGRGPLIHTTGGVSIWMPVERPRQLIEGPRSPPSS